MCEMLLTRSRRDEIDRRRHRDGSHLRRGIELPCFAAFDLLRTTEGTEALRAYYEPYLEIAREHGCRSCSCAPTWRSSPDWGAQLGYTRRSSPAPTGARSS
jgi:hypothetical protein